MKTINELALKHLEAFDCGEYTDRVEMMNGFLASWIAQQEPVAWLHSHRQDSDVITDKVKHVWGGVAVGREAQYTIPLYTLPTKEDLK